MVAGWSLAASRGVGRADYVGNRLHHCFGSPMEQLAGLNFNPFFDDLAERVLRWTVEETRPDKEWPREPRAQGAPRQCWPMTSDFAKTKLAHREFQDLIDEQDAAIP